MKNLMPADKKPICPFCGEKMILVEFQGYYEGFRYFECDNDECDVRYEMDKYQPDDTWKGSYA